MATMERTFLLTMFAVLVLLCGCAGRPAQEPLVPQAATTENVDETKPPAEVHKAILDRMASALKGGPGKTEIVVDENSDQVQLGDLVTIHVTARLPDGRIVNTTRESVGNDQRQQWAAGYAPPERFHPVTIIAGEKGGFPGVGTGVLGMEKNEHREVTVEPESAFGLSDPEKIKQYPTVHRVPRVVTMVPAEFVLKYGIFPLVGKTFGFNPYLEAKILSVAENHTVLEISAKSTDEISSLPYGTAKVERTADEFIIRLTPEAGAAFTLDKQEGFITAVAEDHFTVNFNHPLAGERLLLEMDVLDLAKVSETLAYRIDWLEDYDAGALQARETGRPMVLLLYAGWCEWSRKMMDEVLTDPRITRLRHQFVWVRIDSDIHQEYKEGFEQKTYPTLLILNPREEVLQSLDGFHNVHIVCDVLASVQPPVSAG